MILLLLALLTGLFALAQGTLSVTPGQLWQALQGEGPRGLVTVITQWRAPRVVLALVPTGTPMGFVAILGILALVGIIVRNSVILVTQIDQYERDGFDPWHAVMQATQHRRRPILLTAAAASLGMIPIARDVFWGPMAYAMIGGILSATLLTLLFLPALYVASYKIKENKNPPPEHA